jgi:hypothetical protein
MRHTMAFDLKAWLWFLSSYAPLWIMLGLRFDALPLQIGLVAFGVVCALILGVILRRGSTTRPANTTLTITGDAGSDVSGYLAAYLLPFLTVSDPGLTDVCAYVIFVAVAGIVYVRSGLMQINPTVYLLGRTVRRATVPVHDTSKEVFVISKRGLPPL